MVFAESLEICSIPFNLNEENTSEGGNIMSIVFSASDCSERT